MQRGSLMTRPKSAGLQSRTAPVDAELTLLPSTRLFSRHTPTAPCRAGPAAMTSLSAKPIRRKVMPPLPSPACTVQCGDGVASVRCFADL